LAEDGKEVCFERSEASRDGVDKFRVGHSVEFELQYGFERPCAVNIKRVHHDAASVQEH
jgi:cold shock CspA family protein